MSRSALVNLSNVAALSGVAPSTRLTLLLPGTFGSVSRTSTSVRVSGAGGGAVGGAAITVDVAGGPGGAADEAILGWLWVHPENPSDARTVAAPSARETWRFTRPGYAVTAASQRGQ